MWKTFVRIAIVVIMFMALLWFGGYKVTEVSRRIELKTPQQVFNIDTPDLPSGNETLPEDGNWIDTGNDDPLTHSGSNNGSDNGSNNSEITTSEDIFNTTQPTEQAQFIYSQNYSLTIDGHEYSIGSTTTVGLIRFLSNNCSADDTISCTPIDDAELENSSQPVLSPDGKYLTDEESLDELVANIEVGELENLTDYNRTSFENPVNSYQLNGQTYNRNDYSWHTSDYLISEDPFQYVCPYTGMTITNENNLDYDHIVPLHSVYLRGGSDWTAEQMNAYAYDQDVGIDVYYSANRSKADKGPAEWLPSTNVGSYCYSWLVICDEYDLVMTQEEIDVCTAQIQQALENGETIEFLGGQ